MYNIYEIINKNDIKDFWSFSAQININNKNWIQPLNKEVYKIFDKDQNPVYLQGGKSKLWIIKSEDGLILGRIAAFINPDYVLSEGIKVGGIGFFECINSYNVAEKLFDTAKEWLSSKGSIVMDGNINFGEKINYWGVMVSGFDNMHLYGHNYNPPYYKELFEKYGFKNYYDQYIFERTLQNPDPPPPILAKIMSTVTPEDGYEVLHIDKKNPLDFVLKFCSIYNESWSKAHKGIPPLKIDSVLNLFESMKFFLDPKVTFLILKHNEAIGCFVGLPEPNEIFQKTGPILNIINILKIMYLKYKQPKDRIVGLIFGVHPNYQNSPVASVMFDELQKNISGRYKRLIVSWIGSFNPKMISMMKKVTHNEYAKYTTYRYMIDKKIKFEPKKEILT